MSCMFCRHIAKCWLSVQRFISLPPRDPEGRLRSNKRLNRNVFCQLVGDFILVPLHVQGGDVLEEEQTLLPLPGIDT